MILGRGEFTLELEMSGKVIDVNVLLKFISAEIEANDIVGCVGILGIQKSLVLNF